jgi:hypothetical protein
MSRGPGDKGDGMGRKRFCPPFPRKAWGDLFGGPTGPHTIEWSCCPPLRQDLLCILALSGSHPLNHPPSPRRTVGGATASGAADQPSDEQRRRGVRTIG